MSEIQWSFRNHMHYSWSGRDERTSSEDQFELRYSACLREPKSFREECIEAVRLIAQDAGGEPIVVMMSGGVDSEVVCRAFREAGIPIRARLFRYKKAILEDVRLAREFCESQSIPLEIVDFDEDRFLSDDLPKYAEVYRIHEPFAAFDIHRMETTNGYPVFGAGDLVLEQADGQITSYELGSFSIPRVYQRRSSRKGCYQFFQYTPELMLSFLREPILRKWIEIAPRVGLANSRYWKMCLYKSIWPDMVFRKKYTGYERFAGPYLKAQEELTRRHGYRGDRLSLPVESLIRALEPIMEESDAGDVFRSREHGV